jgi:predicted RNase H-like nuclease
MRLGTNLGTKLGETTQTQPNTAQPPGRPTRADLHKRDRNLAEDQIDAVLCAYIAMFFTTHANSSPMIHLLEP